MSVNMTYRSRPHSSCFCSTTLMVSKPRRCQTDLPVTGFIEGNTMAPPESPTHSIDSVIKNKALSKYQSMYF